MKKKTIISTIFLDIIISSHLYNFRIKWAGFGAFVNADTEIVSTDVVP